MKRTIREKLLCILLALGWLVACNVAIAETALVLLHDFADSHHDASHSHSEGGHSHHGHHTSHHPGHDQEHRHGDDSSPHSHGKVAPTDFTSPRQAFTVTPLEFSFFQPLNSVGFSYSDNSTVWETVKLERANGPPGKSIFYYLLSSLTVSSNAPPATPKV